MVQKKKRKIKFIGLAIIVLVFLVTLQIGYCAVNLKVKGVIITGNSYLSNNYIKDETGITTDSNILFLSSYIAEKNLTENVYIKSVEVTKTFFRNVYIDVEENKTLFYYSYKDLIILEGENEIEQYNKDVGIPTLINYTPSNILSTFVTKLSLIEQDLINKISEIEYAPSYKDSIVIDEELFIFRMNDGNTVHVNNMNLNKFNNYNKILEQENRKGTLYLDSANDGHVFEIYNEIEEKEEEIEDELQ